MYAAEIMNGAGVGNGITRTRKQLLCVATTITVPVRTPPLMDRERGEREIYKSLQWNL